MLGICQQKSSTPGFDWNVQKLMRFIDYYQMCTTNEKKIIIKISFVSLSKSKLQIVYLIDMPSSVTRSRLSAFLIETLLERKQLNVTRQTKKITEGLSRISSMQCKSS